MGMTFSGAGIVKNESEEIVNMPLSLFGKIKSFAKNSSRSGIS